MFKKSKIFCLIATLLLVIIPFLSAGTSVYAAENTTLSVEEGQYIFTEIIVKNENKYVVNEDELKNSQYNYSEDEQDNFRAFAYYMNQAITENPSGTRVKRGAVDTFKGCLSDATGIAKGALKELDKAISKGEWFSVAGMLITAGGVAGTKIGWAAALVFLAGCGATVAS